MEESNGKAEELRSEEEKMIEWALVERGRLGGRWVFLGVWDGFFTAVFTPLQSWITGYRHGRWYCTVNPSGSDVVSFARSHTSGGTVRSTS